eukprot:TRINITY_DN3996_c0_g1_i1.p1 TRINITY_DN3996_c0_g1~~TRINITY_DN3996_c0_g1_i1.p1  ORF type:complete len:539 (+),score=121.49 TRINITY_DN3996_c0_g1_i1:68-1684(+)
MLLSDTHDDMLDITFDGCDIQEEMPFHLRFIDASPEDLDDIISQLKWELVEGNGETTVNVGYDDDGRFVGLDEADYRETVQCLQEVAKALSADVSVHCAFEQGGKLGSAVVLRRNGDSCSDIRIAVCGNVDAGKSTLIGVLTSSVLDNGRGGARNTCFRHAHEFETGRTSSIGYQIMGFASNGTCVNDTISHKITWQKVVKNSHKVVSFLDLAGHEKYLKTTITGMTGHLPDYCLLVVGANMGITRMTREHLTLAASLDIPVIIMITKIDISPSDIRKRTLDSVKRILRSIRRTPLVIKSEQDLIASVKNVRNNAIAPIFEISSVTGTNIDTVKTFLNLISPRIPWNKLKNCPPEVQIDSIHHITGVGTVVTGVVIRGVIENKQEMLIGPFGDGRFEPVKIKSMQINRTPVNRVETGRSGGFAINIKRSAIRKGMYLVSPESNAVATRTFEAKIFVLKNSTSTLKKGYSPVVQCMGIRQAARVTEVVDKEMIRTGDKGTVKFEFMYRPEYIKEGMRMILTEGKSKAFGIISSVKLVDE